MEPKTQHGYLVLADISGYTAFIAGTELEHAQEIIGDLLEVILARVRPLLTLSKLEGDAVFCYAPESTFARGETLLELVEASYVAFRDRREGVRRRTTCTCQACKSIPMLDLKFIVHHGDYIVQDIAGIKELAGSDVNLIHRLLKNHITEATGWKAYAMFTESSLAHMGVRPTGLAQQAESYEHLGNVETFSSDLHARYDELKDSHRQMVTAQQAYVTVVTDIAASLPVLWEWLSDPAKILLWSPNRNMRPGLRPGGRMGAGARNHCLHGKKQTMIETVLDWRPFEYFTVRQDSAMIAGGFLITTQLEPIDPGTRVSVYIRFEPLWMLPNALKPGLSRFLCKTFGMVEEYSTLKTQVENPGVLLSSPAVTSHA